MILNLHTKPTCVKRANFVGPKGGHIYKFHCVPSEGKDYKVHVCSIDAFSQFPVDTVSNKTEK